MAEIDLGRKHGGQRATNHEVPLIPFRNPNVNEGTGYASVRAGLVSTARDENRATLVARGRRGPTTREARFPASPLILGSYSYFCSVFSLNTVIRLVAEQRAPVEAEAALSTSHESIVQTKGAGSQLHRAAGYGSP